jgi:hypothetical protein
MDVPEEVKILKQSIAIKEGGRKDDVEMTFKKGGRFRHLGEATLMNRVKVSPLTYLHNRRGTKLTSCVNQSHPDVGERYYPDLLKTVREQARLEMGQSQSEEASHETESKSLLIVPTTTIAASDATTNEPSQIKTRRRAPTIVVDLTPSDQPSYGEDPGPGGSMERKEAFEMRKADAVPDVVRVVER